MILVQKAVKCFKLESLPQHILRCQVLGKMFIGLFKTIFTRYLPNTKKMPNSLDPKNRQNVMMIIRLSIKSSAYLLNTFEKDILTLILSNIQTSENAYLSTRLALA